MIIVYFYQQNILVTNKNTYSTNNYRTKGIRILISIPSFIFSETVVTGQLLILIMWYKHISNVMQVIVCLMWLDYDTNV